MAQEYYSYLYSLRLRGQLNNGKSMAFSFGATEPQARSAGLNPAIPWGVAQFPDGSSREGGMVIYGAPIGVPAFERAYLQAALDNAFVSLRRLSRMDRRQHKLILLRTSACKKLQHVQRLCPTFEHADILREYDRHLTAALKDLTLGRGAFTELAGQLAHLPAALGGIGVESVADRADATFFSSVLSANFRLERLAPDWLVKQFTGTHPTFRAFAAAKARLLRTDGFDILLRKMSIQDRPLRVQGKIMNLIHAAQHRALARSLPDREAVTLHHQAQNPHWVSISASADPSLQMSDDVLATNLALRLSLTQLPTSSFTDNASDRVCPGCGKQHVSAHLEGAITCYDGGNPGRLKWHTELLRAICAAQRHCNQEVTYEPPSLAPPDQPQVRVDCANHSILPGASVHADLRTYCASSPATIGREANLPGILADLVEREKRQKHLAVIRAHNPRDLYFTVAVSEHGAFGPEAEELFDLVFSRSECPSAYQTYWRRVFSVKTAEAVHAMYHRQVTGARRKQGEVPLPTADALHGQTEHADEVGVTSDTVTPLARPTTVAVAPTPGEADTFVDDGTHMRLAQPDEGDEGDYGGDAGDTVGGDAGGVVVDPAPATPGADGTGDTPRAGAATGPVVGTQPAAGSGSGGRQPDTGCAACPQGGQGRGTCRNGPGGTHGPRAGVCRPAVPGHADRTGEEATGGGMENRRVQEALRLQAARGGFVGGAFGGIARTVGGGGTLPGVWGGFGGLGGGGGAWGDLGGGGRQGGWPGGGSPPPNFDSSGA